VSRLDLGSVETPRHGLGSTSRNAHPTAPRQSHVERAITALIVFGPLAGVVIAAIALFGHGVSTLDLVLLAVFYAATGHGLSAGFHRLFSHRSFKASRWLRLTLALLGSLAFEGSVNSWVANHRRHHAYTDADGDPHSPYAYGTTPWARTRGAIHAHVGWLFQGQNTDTERWAPDLVRDTGFARISSLFAVFCVASLAAPAILGLAFTGTLSGAIGGLVWGGLVRVFVLHQTTFAVNSACHIWGQRPFRTRGRDRSTNFAPLAILSMGDNWHNFHHSSPTTARHGVDRGQLDSTARLIWLLERTGAVWDVRWPDRASVNRSRRTSRPGLGLDEQDGDSTGVHDETSDDHRPDFATTAGR
jgi:stearoyl-CoA desaturase (delta-9 desaturase)